ncbi:MAG: fumarylacetoacetate hydrolase family protein [Candidatus Bathyarchaeia archaeon]
MKLLVFNSNRLGCLLEDETVVDLNLAYLRYLQGKGVSRPHAHANSILPCDLLSFIEEGGSAIEAAMDAIDYAKKNQGGPDGEKILFKLDGVRIQAPLPSLASKIAMAGANFYDHSAGALSMIQSRKITVEDIKREVEAGKYKPWGFWKHARNVIGPDEPIIYPGKTQRLDYEVEVAAIFGKRGKDLEEKDAMDYIFGYTILNDLSLRDQEEDRGFFLPKNFDTSAPMGPYIVTADEVGDPHGLRMKLRVNGIIRQDGSMKDMIRPFPFWISWLTRDLTFYPGDIICGGTCAGTALDTSPRDHEGRTKPDRFLKAGDVVEAWVEKIGTLRNPVIEK